MATSVGALGCSEEASIRYLYEAENGTHAGVFVRAWMWNAPRSQRSRRGELQEASEAVGDPPSGLQETA